MNVSISDIIVNAEGDMTVMLSICLESCPIRVTIRFFRNRAKFHVYLYIYSDVSDYSRQSVPECQVQDLAGIGILSKFELWLRLVGEDLDSHYEALFSLSSKIAFVVAAWLSL